MKDIFPTTFPSGQGSDFAGVVAETGSDVDGFSVGDEVIGFSEKRASHAEFVVVPAGEPDRQTGRRCRWEVAGALYVAGTTAYAAVRAVDLAQGDVVAVAGAAGGVGSIAVQLAVERGATVLGIAGPSNDEWLRAHGVIPVNYGDDLAERLRAAAPAGRIDAFLDFFGGGYVELAVDELGRRARPGGHHHRLRRRRTVQGADRGQCRRRQRRPCWPNSAALVADGRLEVPIAEVFALDDVREAYRTLEQRHTGASWCSARNRG